MRRGIVGVVLAVALTGSGCGIGEPPETPDLVGLPLDVARERAKGFELTEYDSSDRGRAVWDASNWIVERQDPPPGATAGDRTIWLTVRNVTDAGETSTSTVETPGKDWLAVLRAQGAGYLEFVDRIEVLGDHTVDVYLNRGDRREDGIQIGSDGETDRAVALELCYALQFAGHTGEVWVYAPTGGALLTTDPMRESLIVDGASSCQQD